MPLWPDWHRSGLQFFFFFWNTGHCTEFRNQVNLKWCWWFLLEISNQIVYFSIVLCSSTSGIVCFSHTQRFWKFFRSFLLDVSVSLSHPQVNYLWSYHNLQYILCFAVSIKIRVKRIVEWWTCSRILMCKSYSNPCTGLLLAQRIPGGWRILIDCLDVLHFDHFFLLFYLILYPTNHIIWILTFVSIGKI